MHSSIRFSAALFLSLAFFSAPAFADDPKNEDEAKEDIWSRDTLTGDWGGLRTKLSDKGLDLGANIIIDTQGNPTGGTSRGAIVFERTAIELGLDFNKLVGAKGLTGFINAYSIEGRGLSTTHLNANYATTSNIEVPRADFRLFTFWLQQELFGGFGSLRFGQIAADDEFALSDYGGTFVNAAFGWPVAFAANFPNGGPAFPYATPGIRLKLGEDKPWSVQAAIFNGDPSPGPGTAQQNDPSGTRFELDSGTLVMMEGAYKINSAGNATGLPGTYKAGVWFHTGTFGDLREDNTGLSLADPGSTGTPRTRANNYGLYAMGDQMIWHKGGDREHGVGLFARGFIQPEDRNIVAFQGDLGVVAKGVLFGRKDDSVGLGLSYIGVSNRQRRLDEDSNFFNATAAPLEDHETAIELTYHAQVAPWLTLQPNFQYIFHPGGNVADPTDASGLSAVPDAAVFALRTEVKF